MRSRFGVFVVAMVLLAAAMVLILVFTPSNDPESRAIALLLGSTLVSLVGALHNSLKIDQVDKKVDDVAGNVNGRMSEMLNKVPDQPGSPGTTPPEGNSVP